MRGQKVSKSNIKVAKKLQKSLLIGQTFADYLVLIRSSMRNSYKFMKKQKFKILADLCQQIAIFTKKQFS